jgi:heat shock protein HslJ
MRVRMNIGKRLAVRDQKISILFLILFFIAVMFAPGCKSSLPQIRSSSAFDNIPFKSLRVPSGIVRLVNGEYREYTGAEDSPEIFVYLDEHMTTGTIHQIERAIVVLVSRMETGEVYYDLALLTKTDSGWKNTDAVELGDRVKIGSISIADDEIIVNLKVHGPYDRQCCSTLETVYRYQVSGGRMEKRPDPLEFASAPELVGTLWKWQETYFKNDTYVQSHDPNSYTIQLVEDGSVKVRADCNMAGGKYVLDGEYIDFHITQSTLAACPPESLSEKFMADLRSAVRYYFKNKKLYVVMKGDSGVMVFSD